MLRFARPRQPASTAPYGLLELASSVKFRSPHRVLFHDARVEAGGNRALRSVAALSRPDVAVLWLHPAFLADGLEAARAVRQAGCELVLGAGPLIDIWPEGASTLPELDGLLPSALGTCLRAALDLVVAGGDAKSLQEALAPRDGVAGEACEVDRKLVDYAQYSSGWGGTWIPSPAGAKRGLGVPSAPAEACTVVLLHREDGELLEPSQVLDDLVACRLLGIPNCDLQPRGGCDRPDIEWIEALAAGLALLSEEMLPPRLRLATVPETLGRLPLDVLQGRGLVALDFGSAGAGDAQALDDLLFAGAAAMRRGLEATGSLLVGRPGYSVAADQRGLARAIEAGFPQEVACEVQIGSLRVPAWADWLEAPGSDFLPPGTTSEHLALVARGRQALGAGSTRPGSLAGLGTRVRQLLGRES